MKVEGNIKLRGFDKEGEAWSVAKACRLTLASEVDWSERGSWQ